MDRSSHTPDIGQALTELVRRYDVDKEARRQLWKYLGWHTAHFAQQGLYRIILRGPLTAWISPWAARERVICFAHYLTEVSEALQREHFDCLTDAEQKCHQEHRKLWQSSDLLRTCFESLKQGCLSVLQWANMAHLAHVLAIRLEEGMERNEWQDGWTFPVHGMGDGHPLPPLRARTQLAATEVFARRHAHSEYQNACAPSLLHLELTPRWDWFFPCPFILNMMLQDRRRLYHGPQQDWENEDYSMPCSMEQESFRSPFCSPPEDVTRPKVATKE